MTANREHTKPAMAYARGVVAGEVLAGRMVRLACKRQLDDLKRWHAGSEAQARRLKHPYWFDKKAAERVCNFIEKLPHTKGKWAAKGQRIVLEPWQQWNLTTLFGWKRTSDGKRRFRKAYDEIPRKNAKSTLAAGIGLYLFCADAEFGAEVYSGATSEKQAFEVFRPAWLMAYRSAGLREKFGIRLTGNPDNPGTMYRTADGSRFETVIGRPGDGASPSCAIHDEYHEHQTSDQSDTMETGMGAREQPLQLFITTAGSYLAGPCYALRRDVIEILEGRIANPEIFAVIYGIDEDDDWTTEEALRKANPNYGVSVDAEFLRQRQIEAQQSARKQNAFKTKHLNIWVGAKNAWMNMAKWAKCPKALPLELLYGRLCFAAVDLASKLDLAALILLFPATPDDPLWHVHPFFYLPEDRTEDEATPNAQKYKIWAEEGYITLTPGNVTDFAFIETELLELKDKAVKEVGFDPWQATQLATRMLEQGVPMVEIGQTVRNFSEPMKAVEALVLQGRMAHPRNPVLTWMMSNVVAKEDAKENIYPRKEVGDSKIDGPVGLIMTMNRAIAAEPKKPSVYEGRGIALV